MQSLCGERFTNYGTTLPIVGLYEKIIMSTDIQQRKRKLQNLANSSHYCFKMAVNEVTKVDRTDFLKHR